MSILVDLLPYFSDKSENIATRGLHSVLKRPEARAALCDFIQARFNLHFAITRINAQVAQGANGQPDLEGRNVDGNLIFFGEVKFWAGLTPNQPIAYLQALNEGGMLLFVAPRVRRERLWPELRRRLQEGGQEPNEVLADSLIIAGGKYLALATGPALLQALLEATLQNPEISCDIRQLQALWEAFDTPDLPPIDPGTSANQGLARMVSGFWKLPAKIADAAANRSLLDTERGRRISIIESGCIYTYLRIGQLDGWVIYSPPNWGQYGISPIWFETRQGFAPGNIPIWPAITASFAQFAGQESFVSMSDSACLDAIAVPLTILPNAIESALVDNIVTQLSGLADGIANYQGPN